MNKKRASQEFLDEYVNQLNFDEKDIRLLSVLYDNFLASEFAQNVSNDYLSEYHFEFDYNNVYFKGDIDLLIKNTDGSYDIVDFKTNKNIENSLLDYNKQLFIYKKSMEHQGYKIQNLYLVNIKESGLTKIQVSFEDIEIAQQALDIDINNIKSLCAQNVIKNSEHCKHCEYNYLCQ
jgi:CRISPR/Cas system-associated exonuclease Cas4 (RecB family)